MVDDDLGTRETFASALAFAEYLAHAVSSGVEALSFARTSPVSAAVIDLRLPDMSGLDVVQRLQLEAYRFPFIVVSAFLSTPLTVEAMRLGASDVLEKPVGPDDLCAGVARALDAPRAFGSRARAAFIETDRTAATLRSSAERWAHAVLAVCEADGDPRTIEEWARLAGMSNTTLGELSRMLGMAAHDARDFSRMLRAVVKAHRGRCSPIVFLDIADERTMRSLFRRAGVNSLSTATVEAFLSVQTFVDPAHPALWLLRVLLSRPVQ